VEPKLAAAINTLEQAIEAEAHSVPETWQTNRVRLVRATATCTRLIARASALDRISARRMIAAIIAPQNQAASIAV